MSLRFQSSISEALKNPTQVKELYIHPKKDGEMALLPRISELVNLSKISISDCPEEISLLTELESLIIYGKTFNTIPLQSLAKLKKLKKVILNVSKEFDKNAAYSLLPNCDWELRSH